MAEKTITIRDHFGNLREFETVKEFRKFLALEREAWSWIPDNKGAPNDVGRMLRSAHGTLANLADQLERGEINLPQFQNSANSLFQGNTPQILFSDMRPGANVLLIREELGADSALLAYRILTVSGAYSTANLNHARLWNMLANPSLIRPDHWLSEHQRKLAASRASMTKEVTKYEEATEVLLQQAKEDNLEAHARYRRLAKAVIRGASRRAEQVRSEADSALANIEATRATYAERMRLEAPVRYWRTKSKSHGATARNWGLALVGYLILVALLVWFAFPRIWEAAKPGAALSGQHFLLVAIVGAGLTLIFWMARLIVRIYLGERHLQTDAQERRVMTQAYLALIKESAASDEERIVILSALFRAAQDGIVKEDGAGDISLPAMIARLLDARR